MNIHFSGNILMNGYFLGIIPGSDCGCQGTVQSASYTAPGNDEIQGEVRDDVYAAVTLPAMGISYSILIHHATCTWKSLQHFCANFNITPCGTVTQ